MDFTKINELAFNTARGCYQNALLSGREPWSGAGLQGMAQTYAGGYARSRAALLTRLNAAGHSVGASFSTKLVMDAKAKRLKRRLVVTVAGVDYDFVSEVALAVDSKARPLLAA